MHSAAMRVALSLAGLAVISPSGGRCGVVAFLCAFSPPFPKGIFPNGGPPKTDHRAKSLATEVGKRPDAEREEGGPLTAAPLPPPGNGAADPLPYAIDVGEWEGEDAAPSATEKTGGSEDWEDVRRRDRRGRRRVRPHRTLVVRHLEDRDLPALVRMCVRELGPANPRNDPRIRVPPPLRAALGPDRAGALDRAGAYAENYVLAWAAYLGLYARVRRRMWGEDEDGGGLGLGPDHHVLCLSAPGDGGGGMGGEEVVGIAEISLQPPRWTATPLVLPLSLKRFLSRLGGGPPPLIGHDNHLLLPYVSNVLIAESYRGLGYGTALMGTTERHALSLGWDVLTLHVDGGGIGDGAESAALALYRRMGYGPMVDGPRERRWWLFPPSGVSDGKPQLYLGKWLHSQNAVEQTNRP